MRTTPATAQTTEAAQFPEFSVLLGADFAGKSSALGRLRETEPDWQYFSTDTKFLGPQHGYIAELRRLTGQVLPSLGSVAGPEFLAGLLQTAVLHLRDEIVRAEPGRPVLVDSYYYKILAKCRLLGVAQDNPMLQWWRSFPQPRRVVLLEVGDDSSWRRCAQGRRLNLLEYYGDHPQRDGFDRYQRDLRKVMAEEISGIPVSVVEECASPEQAALRIREVLAHDGS